MNCIEKVIVLSDNRVRLKFDDGTEGEYDMTPLIARGGIFAPLADPAYFAQVTVNEDLGTIVWPNGADVCPDVLHAAITGEPVLTREDGI